MNNSPNPNEESDIQDIEQALGIYIKKLERGKAEYLKKSNRARYWLNTWQIISGIATFSIAAISAAIAFLLPQNNNNNDNAGKWLKYGLVTFTALSSVAANTIIRFRFEEKWQTFESAKNDYDALISRGKLLLATHKNIEKTNERKYGLPMKDVTLHDDNAYLLSMEIKIHDDVENRLFVTSKGSSPRADEPQIKKELNESQIQKELDEIQKKFNGLEKQLSEAQQLAAQSKNDIPQVDTTNDSV